ncbi:hypothetical protein NQZ79_g5398 [Umbelopsis isabellina]|nr:hypothetical protein NQZ79_g5398 [Umbelopsis isabellina]
MSVCTSINHYTSVQDKENERLRQIIREKDAQIEVLQQAHLSSIEILSSNFSRLEHIVNEFCDLLNDASKGQPTLPEDDIRWQLFRTMSVAQLQSKRLRQRIAKWRDFVERGVDDWFGSPESIMVLVEHKELLCDIHAEDLHPNAETQLDIEDPMSLASTSSQNWRDVPSIRSRNDSTATSDTYTSSIPPKDVWTVSPVSAQQTTHPQRYSPPPRTSSLISLPSTTSIPPSFEVTKAKRQSPRQSKSATTRMITSLRKSMTRKGTVA